MRRRIALSLGVGALVVALLAAPASAQRQPYQTNDYLGFHSILPPGTKGVFNATELTTFLANGTTPAHTQDQLGMYRDLIYARRASPPAESPTTSRTPASASPPARRSAPTARARADVVRDKGFGVPHVYGDLARTRCSAPATSAPRTGSSSWTSCATPAAASCPGSPAAPTRRWTATSEPPLHRVGPPEADRPARQPLRRRGRPLQQDVNDYVAA